MQSILSSFHWCITWSLKHSLNTNLMKYSKHFIIHWVNCTGYSFTSGNLTFVHEILQFSKVMIKLNGMYCLVYPHYYVAAFSLLLVILALDQKERRPCIDMSCIYSEFVEVWVYVLTWIEIKCDVTHSIAPCSYCVHCWLHTWSKHWQIWT